MTVMEALDALVARHALRARALDASGEPSPSARPTLRAIPLRSPQRALPEGLRIMFVDDDALAQRTYSRLFPKQQVSMRMDAETALHDALASPPDVIVYDLHMPQVDGATFWERLAVENPQLAARVVLTSESDLLPAAAMRVLDKVPLVKKPFFADDLGAAMASLLSTSASVSSA